MYRGGRGVAVFFYNLKESSKVLFCYDERYEQFVSSVPIDPNF